MTRMLSLAVVAAVSVFLLPIQSLSAQDSTSPCQNCPAQKCPTCQSIEFELAGVDFLFDSSEDDEETSIELANQHEIAIQLSCGCELPAFASNIPFINRIFHNAKPECCEANACNITCEGCQDCTKSSADCAKCDCASTCTAQTIDSSAGTLIRLAGHLQEIEKDEAPTRTDLMNELIELRIRNERLEAELEAAHHRLEMMREMCEVKEQNAALKTRLEMLEKHTIHSAASHARLPAVTTAAHPTHKLAPPINGFTFVPAIPSNPPAPRLHPPTVQTQVHPQPTQHWHHNLNVPQKHLSSKVTQSYMRPVDVQRIAEQLRILHKELGEAKKRADNDQEIQR